jgi:hypothetical protein
MPDKMKGLWIRLDKKGRWVGDQNGEPGFKVSRKMKWKAKKGGWIRAALNWHLPNKRGMGRNKGNAHERETARIFSKWIFGERHYLKRTPLSGGWSSSKMGDVCLDPEIARQKKIKDPPMYVECRSYKDVLQYNVLSWSVWGTPKIYSEWIKEVETKCDGRLPILVIKGNGTDAWILVRAAWLSSNGKCAFNAARGTVRLSTSNYGTVFMLPLKRVRSLGDGESFFEEWVRDGGPVKLKRIESGS